MKYEYSVITSAISLERKSKFTTNNHKKLPPSAVFSCAVLNYGIWVMTVKDHPDETRHSGQARCFPSSERRPRNGWSALFWLFFFTHQQAGTIRSCFTLCETDLCVRQRHIVDADPEAQLCARVGHIETQGQYTDTSRGVKTVPHMDLRIWTLLTHHMCDHRREHHACCS